MFHRIHPDKGAARSSYFCVATSRQGLCSLACVATAQPSFSRLAFPSSRLGFQIGFSINHPEPRTHNLIGLPPSKSTGHGPSHRTSAIIHRHHQDIHFVGAVLHPCTGRSTFSTYLCRSSDVRLVDCLCVRNTLIAL
jgi:hypothetical protein